MEASFVGIRRASRRAIGLHIYNAAPRENVETEQPEKCDEEDRGKRQQHDWREIARDVDASLTFREINIGRSHDAGLTFQRSRYKRQLRNPDKNCGIEND